MLAIVVIFACFFAAWFLVFFRRVECPAVAKSSSRRRSTARSRLRDIAKPNVSASDSESCPVDCSAVTRYCTSDNDCSVMCRVYKKLEYRCDDVSHTCRASMIDVRRASTDRISDTVCDVKSGEYAMLVGYSTLGTALWQCVQLYRQFNGGTFCENGQFEVDARLREPSYRDCQCPDGTTRMVVKLAHPYDVQLPHCVASDTRYFYTDDMIEM